MTTDTAETSLGASKDTWHTEHEPGVEAPAWLWLDD